MRPPARTIILALLLASALSGCGDGDKGGNVVRMKDMEVVDGTATDAMTDLDGVQSEGTAVALPGNATDGAPADNGAQAAPPADSEVLSDQ